MSERHPVAEFVHAFHADLSHWFSGTEDRQTLWIRLQQGTSRDMVLVYPNGQRLDGTDFLKSIEDLYGRSPGFVASISNLELIRGDASYAVVSYIETQAGARQSTTNNQRSALAVVVRDGDGWKWRFIQETALREE